MTTRRRDDPEARELTDPAPEATSTERHAVLKAVMVDFAADPPFGAQQGTYHFGPADRFHGRQVDVSKDGWYTSKKIGWSVEVKANEMTGALRNDIGMPEETTDIDAPEPPPVEGEAAT